MALFSDRGATAQIAVPDGGSWDGPYTPIPLHAQGNATHCCEIAHAILLGAPGPAQGSVLWILSNGERFLWNPAAPNSVSTDSVCDNLVDILFCAGHSLDANGRIVAHGGTRDRTVVPCTPQPRYSYVYDPVDRCWTGPRALVVPVPNPSSPPDNLGFWYPSSVRLADGRIISLGGGSSPLTNGVGQINTCNDTGSAFFNDGWQIFDPAQMTWFAQTSPVAWFPGLPGNSVVGGTNPFYDNNFNYYPLTVLLPGTDTDPDGFLFVPVSTNNRLSNYGTGAFTPASSVSAVMDLGAPGWPFVANPWALRDQIKEPMGNPRNLYHPNGLLRPLQLDGEGLPIPSVPIEVMVLAGTDYNLVPVAGTGGTNPLDHGGRPALAEVQQITSPNQASSTWAANGTRFPNLTYPRIYSNTAILPTGQLFTVGGSRFDFFPFGAARPSVATGSESYERIANPVFVPEMMDLFSAQPTWSDCAPHVSPRLYHSVTLVLQDGRVMVAGGYRGTRSTLQNVPANARANWTLFDPTAIPPVTNPHSDVEIYSPEYLFAGPRPEITGLSLGGPSTDTLYYGSVFEVKIARLGSADPVADIGSVCLLSCGADTHHFDWEQRYVGLHFEPSLTTPTKKLVVAAPANGTIAPPGWYMLFINTSEAATTWRIPSIAKFVKLM